MDSQSMSHACAKMASTKHPVTSLILELSEQLRVRSRVLVPKWVRRNLNTLADQLSNLDAEGWDDSKRVEVKEEFLVWDEFLGAARELFEEKKKLVETGGGAVRAFQGQSRKRRRAAGSALEHW
jgi:hypothetical protein